MTERRACDVIRVNERMFVRSLSRRIFGYWVLIFVSPLSYTENSTACYTLILKMDCVYMYLYCSFAAYTASNAVTLPDQSMSHINTAWASIASRVAGTCLEVSNCELLYMTTVLRKV